MDPVFGNIIMAICFIVGSGLIILEAFMPGFGVAGIFGLVLEVSALVLTGNLYGTTWALIATFCVLALIGIAVFISYRSAMKGRLSKSPLILKDTAVVPSEEKQAETPWIHRDGIVATPLRPAGFIEIDGTRLNASTTGDFLDKGAQVTVTGIQGDHLIVAPRA